MNTDNAIQYLNNNPSVLALISFIIGNIVGPFIFFLVKYFWKKIFSKISTPPVLILFEKGEVFTYRIKNQSPGPIYNIKFEDVAIKVPDYPGHPNAILKFKFSITGENSIASNEEKPIIISTFVNETRIVSDIFQANLDTRYAYMDYPLSFRFEDINHKKHKVRFSIGKNGIVLD